MVTVVHVFKPEKTATQSGLGKGRRWLLEFEPTKPLVLDPLMGWPGNGETRRQVCLSFATRDEAVAYAERQGWVPKVREPHVRIVRLKSYADNFAFNRVA